MRKHWIVAGLALAGLAALTACSDGTGTGGGGSGGSITTGGTGNTGNQGGGGSPTCDNAGSSYCGDLVASDLSGWDSTLGADDFCLNSSFDTYVAFDTCACIDLLSAGGCADLCKDSLNGAGGPSFCDGVAPVAGGMCEDCLLNTNCATARTDCEGDLP
jgi:hypothetical protein